MNKPLNPTQQRVKALLEEAKQLSETPEFNENDDFTLNLLWSYPDPDAEKGHTAYSAVKGDVNNIVVLMAKNMSFSMSYRIAVLMAISHLFIAHPELIQNENGTDD